MTRRGIILGTAAYMAPEQARAKPVDKRADIWAFGCVVYEMLTGKQLFVGETVSDTIAEVLKREFKFGEIAGHDPTRGVRRVLERCLQRDPGCVSLRDIGDARVELMAPDSEPSTATAPAPVERRRGASPLLIAALTVIALAVGGAIAAYRSQLHCLSRNQSRALSGPTPAPSAAECSDSKSSSRQMVVPPWSSMPTRVSISVD